MDLKEKIKDLLLDLPKPIISSKLELRNSPIEGNGIFAIKDINPGEIVIVEQGMEVDGKTVELCEAAGFNTNLCIGYRG